MTTHQHQWKILEMELCDGELARASVECTVCGYRDAMVEDPGSVDLAAIYAAQPAVTYPAAPPPGYAIADAYKQFAAGRQAAEQEMDRYLPLYAERRCAVCGRWRGQHVGASTNDDEMTCPAQEPWFGTTATFVQS